jgi:hypothetical protein
MTITAQEIEKFRSAGLLNEYKFERLAIASEFLSLQNKNPDKKKLELRAILAEKYKLTEDNIRKIVYPKSKLKITLEIDGEK